MTTPTVRPSGAWEEPTEYEEWYRSSLGRAYLAALERVLVPWLAGARGGRVVDIGCGPGLTGDQLLPTGAEVFGVDCSFEMARRALFRSRQAGESRVVAAASVEALPFRGGTFQAALCVNCLEFVEDRRSAFGEIARVLAPSGTAVLGVLNRHSLWELSRRLRRPFTTRSYYHGSFFTRGDLLSLVGAVGLEVEDLRTVVHFPPVPHAVPRGLYSGMERVGARLAPAFGGVILCRARKLP